MLRIVSVSAALALTLFIVLSGSASAQQDGTSPYLVNIQVEPRFVDVSDGPQTVTVTVHITDDLSGFREGFVGFDRPGAKPNYAAYFDPAVLVAGDLVDGKYVSTITLSQYAAYGKWEAVYVALVDNAGNRTDCWGINVPDTPQCSIPLDHYYFEITDEPPPERAVYLPLIADL